MEKLPRKLKKKRWGEIGRRRYLALALMDNKKLIEKIVNLFRV